MRQELEEMERIDNYLMNKMDASERAAFEQEMKTNPELAKNVQLQSDLIQGMERMTMQAQVQAAKSSYRLTKVLQLAVISAVVIATVVASIFAVKSFIEKRNENLSAKQEVVSGDKPLSQDYITPQLFEIDNANDTLIVSEEGMVFVIEKGTFGEYENVTLQLKEAFSAKAIIKARLSTQSDGRPLETGGMFEWRASSNGKAIEPIKEILVSIPAEERKEGMMLFKGVETANGTIDWREPKPIEEFLVCEDIEKLNFYPPGYEERLEELGYKNASKEFKDSLYYSFSALMVANIATIIDRTWGDSAGILYRDREDYYKRESKEYEEKRDVLAEENKRALKHMEDHMIDPIKIAAFWNKKFNNTLLATKAFEERMKFIHGGCRGLLIDYYVKNLDKPMYEIDEMVLKYLKSEVSEGGYKALQELAARRQGRVAMDDVKRRKLQDYYQTQQAEYKEAVLAAHRNYEEDHKAADAQASKMRNTRNNKVDSLKRATFQQEFEMNMDEAYRQLGKKRPKAIAADANSTFPIAATGWYNVDRYVLESTINRTTLDYTDPDTGKKAVIRYDSLKVAEDTSIVYEYSVVYLIPSQLRTYLVLDNVSGVYSYSCNELIDYKLVYLAYKGKQAYLYSLDNAAAKTHTPKLVAISEDELDEFLNKLDAPLSKKDLEEELAYVDSERKWNEHNKKYQANRELIRKLWNVIFGCGEWSYPYEMDESFEEVLH